MPYTYLGSATESYYVPRLTIAIYVPSRHSGLPLIRVLQAGHTYHFDFNSFSESTIRDLTSKKFFEVKVPSKGNQGYETLHLDYGGSNGLNARVTLYPPAAVGGAWL